MAEPWDVPLEGLDIEPINTRFKRNTKPPPPLQYARFTSAKRVHCEVCIAEVQAKTRTYPWQAAYRRNTRDTSVLLCTYHCQEAKVADAAKVGQVVD